MTKRMLIDATHSEETRVVVLSGNRVEEFDFESATKKQLKGNIYLAKVTRVEPSLQAAFVDYGGNRHGFLAFSEIHPDYYQIPVADREALLREEREIAQAEAETDAVDDGGADAEGEAEAGAVPENAEAVEAGSGGDEPEGAMRDEAEVAETTVGGSTDPYEDYDGEGEDDTEIEVTARRRRPRRQRYKIQEVIKRRQILLVQVVKEERGNKGAALTTYLSLAGRYCVLMPNTARGGGISRKINNPAERKKLKSHLAALDVPDGMAAILRTAALERSKAELRRDCDYLVRVWGQTRELTLKSIAPELVYEEANLIKRSIRDLYTKDLDEVVVDGEDGYKTAKDFMRMLIPSHAKKVQPYKDASIPLFHRYQVESQLDAMHSSDVELKSGGSVVISPTEALVAIDVNSGRSTRERDIEETAYKTNLEAAEEIARQLRLRDLAGLIVIDFIDMTDRRNQGTVERRLKEAMRSDRARIQIGKISSFGLLELSRQRLRPSLIEASTQACQQCGGSGVVRSTESAALHVLRVIEEEGIRERSSHVRLTVPTVVALYILNQKRPMLTEIEQRYDFQVMVNGDDKMVPPAFNLERLSGKSEGEAAETAGREEAREEKPRAAEEKPGRRRRSRRPRKTEAGEAKVEAAEAVAEAGTGEEAEAAGEQAKEEPGAKSARPRRRGKRGGRRRSRKKTEGEAAETTLAAEGGGDAAPAAADGEAAPKAEPAAADGDSEAEATEKPKTRRRRTAKAKPGGRTRSRRKSGDSAAIEAEAAVEAAPEPASEDGAMADVTAEPAPEAKPAPARKSARGTEKSGNGRNGNGGDSDVAEGPPVQDVEPPITDDGPKRRGWWNRFSG